VPGVSTPGLMLNCTVVEGESDDTLPSKAELKVAATTEAEAVSSPPRVHDHEKACGTPEGSPPTTAVSTTRSALLTAAEPRWTEDGVVRSAATDGRDDACEMSTLAEAVRGDHVALDLALTWSVNARQDPAFTATRLEEGTDSTHVPAVTTLSIATQGSAPVGAVQPTLDASTAQVHLQSAQESASVAPLLSGSNEPDPSSSRAVLATVDIDQADPPAMTGTGSDGATSTCTDAEAVELVAPPEVGSVAVTVKT